jgi:hypothetical protein
MATPLNQPQPAKQRNYLPWILIGCGVLLLGGLVVAMAGFGIWYYYAQPAQSTRSGARPARPSGNVRLVSDHGIQTVEKSWNNCTAFAPADWTIVGNEQRIAIGVDLASPDQSLTASYGVAGVVGGDYYGMGTPELYIQKLMETAGSTGFEFDDQGRSVNGYTLRYWRAVAHGHPVRGFALYQTFDSDDPNMYIISLRLGSTEASQWEEKKNLVYDIAASIRCTKHLFPAQESNAREPQGSSKDQIEDDLSTKREEAMLGFQNVYSPTTGEHWEASYSDYNPTGPDGPGYYRPVGSVGGYEKLNEGFPPN